MPPARLHPIRNRVLIYGLLAAIAVTFATRGKPIVAYCWTALTYADVVYSIHDGLLPFRRADGSLTAIGTPRCDHEHQAVWVGSMSRFQRSDPTNLRIWDVATGEPLRVHVLDSPVALVDGQFSPAEHGFNIALERDPTGERIAPWIRDQVSFEEWFVSLPEFQY